MHFFQDPIISLDADSVEHTESLLRKARMMFRSFLSTLTALSTREDS